MKRNTIAPGLIAFSVLCLAQQGQAQTADDEGGGEYRIGVNTAANPCISTDQYRIIQQQCADNIKALGLEHTGQLKATSTLFSWPLRADSGLTDCNFYSVSAYVDEDTTSGMKDYNCGTTTYNGHFGTDIFIFPYPFYKMDHNQVAIIAAAPGTIVNKSDGNFDKNCASNSLTANYVVVQHADGSEALYLHMKSGSLTSKPIGSAVVAGEFLGRVGSSGSSTGPHLHFEVWKGNSVATRQDPFSGNCNALNSSSWWASQPPYKNPSVIKLSVNHAQAVLPPCPATETPNEDSCFAVGTPSAYFYVFYKDETMGMVDTLRILDALGATVDSWVSTSTSSFTGSYHYWSKPLPAAAGVYTFKASYNGQICTKTFKINCQASSSGVSSTGGLLQLEVHPNPATSVLNISGQGLGAGGYRLVLYNMMGQAVYAERAVCQNGSLQKNIPIATLPAGIYYLSLESARGQAIRRILKQ